MPRIDEATRRARAAVYRPVVATLEARGVSQTWLARRLGLGRNRLWNYLNGHDRVPLDFITRVCDTLALPASIITIPDPRDLYIQSPRQRTASTPKGERHGDATTIIGSQRPVRRTGRTQAVSDAPAGQRRGRASHAARASHAVSSASGAVSGRA